MKKIFFFLFCVVGLYGYSQDEYYRIVDWKFYPENVIQLTDSTYSTDAIPFDYNDQGSIQRIVGNYVVDFVGHRYSVIDSTSTTITVLDIYHTGQAPQTAQVARCYRSVGNGAAEFIGSVDYSPLDESARWKLNGSDNELLWRHINGVAANGLHKDSDTIKLGGTLTEDTKIDLNTKRYSIEGDSIHLLVNKVMNIDEFGNITYENSPDIVLTINPKDSTSASLFIHNNGISGNQLVGFDVNDNTSGTNIQGTPTNFTMDTQTSDSHVGISGYSNGTLENNVSVLSNESKTIQISTNVTTIFKHNNIYSGGTIQDTTGIKYVNIPESYFQDETLVTKHYVDNLVGTPIDSLGNAGYFTNYKALSKEDKANKENTTVSNDTIKYPTVNLLKTYADTKAPASGSANYIQASPSNPQNANILINGSITSRPLDNNYSAFSIQTHSNTQWHTAYFASDRFRGTIPSPLPVENGDLLFSLYSSGYDGGALRETSKINFEVDGTVSSGVVPSNISFYTTNTLGLSQVRAKINPSGDFIVTNLASTNTRPLAVTSAGQLIPTTKDTLFTTIAISDETTALTVGLAKRTFRILNCTLVKVMASVTTAPTGSALILDINVGGTSALSTKLSIDASEKSSKTAASQAVISNSVIYDDAEITIDIDQIGSVVAGTGAKIKLCYLRN